MPTNGRLDTSTLVKVDGWAYLELATARAWIGAGNELVALGYPRPTITEPDGAYRNYDGQVRMKAYWTAQGIPLNAATPGTSNHGLGTCVDIFENWRWPRKVLVEVMGRHGFVFDYPPELWHAHRTSINPADNTVSTASLNLTRITEEEDIMARAVVVQDQKDQHFGWIAVVTENGQLHEIKPGPGGNEDWWKNLAACYNPVLEAKPVTEQQYITFLSANQPSTPTGFAPVDYAAIASAVDGALADNFAATPAATVAALKDAL